MSINPCGATLVWHTLVCEQLKTTWMHRLEPVSRTNSTRSIVHRGGAVQKASDATKRKRLACGHACHIRKFTSFAIGTAHLDGGSGILAEHARRASLCLPIWGKFSCRTGCANVICYITEMTGWTSEAFYTARKTGVTGWTLCTMRIAVLRHMAAAIPAHCARSARNIAWRRPTT